MNTFMSENVSRNEQCRRTMIGGVILALVLASPSAPAWLALVSLYPFMTALVSWCPINAVVAKVLAKFKHKDDAVQGMHQA